MNATKTKEIRTASTIQKNAFFMGSDAPNAQQTTKTELLKHNRKALQFLHSVNGFDFEKPFYIEKIEGRFTHRQINKMISANLGDNYAASLLLLKVDQWSKRKDLCHIGMTPDKFYPTAKAGQWYRYNIDYFFSIGDFEETRKNRTETVYIIAQKTEYLRTPAKAPAISATMRYKIVEHGITRSGDGRGNCWISRIQIIPQTGNGEKIEYKPFERFYASDVRSDNILDYIDKSGYLLHPQKFDLKTRARKLKAEREKAAYLKTDYTERKTAIYNGVYEIQTMISNLALQANTRETANTLYEKSMDFSWLVSDVERMKKAEYNSNSEAERAFKNIEEKINEILNGGAEQ